MTITWDPDNASIHYRKHLVSFNEAATVFDTLTYKEFYDEEHSITEDRYTVIGYSSLGRLVRLTYTFREPDTIFIITARLVNHS